MPVRNWCRAAVWVWGVGWIEMQIAGRHSYPGSSSLERWLEIRLVCADMVRGVELVAPTTLVIRYRHH